LKKKIGSRLLPLSLHLGWLGEDVQKENERRNRKELKKSNEKRENFTPKLGVV
jgi:hypothetical protein